VPPDGDTLITRDGVMAAFWRDKLPKWVGVPVCVNAGDRVLEGTLFDLGQTKLIVSKRESPTWSSYYEVAYDDIVAVERVGVPG
jgi:hypothetical protein